MPTSRQPGQVLKTSLLEWTLYSMGCLLGLIGYGVSDLSFRLPVDNGPDRVVSASDGTLLRTRHSFQSATTRQKCPGHSSAFAEDRTVSSKQ